MIIMVDILVEKMHRILRFSQYYCSYGFKPGAQYFVQHSWTYIKLHVCITLIYNAIPCTVYNVHRYIPILIKYADEVVYESATTCLVHCWSTAMIIRCFQVIYSIEWLHLIRNYNLIIRKNAWSNLANNTKPSELNRAVCMYIPTLIDPTTYRGN